MRNIYTIITGICLILLCTACKQFTVDIDEYLSLLVGGSDCEGL